MFLNIKNKFRFATVSLLLASFVTVVSSTSALDVDVPFYFNVEEHCSVASVYPTWAVEIDGETDGQTVQGGDAPEIRVYTNFAEGFESCEMGIIPVQGSVTSVVSITDEIWTTFSDCASDPCPASGLSEVVGSFIVPDLAEVGSMSGNFSLSWLPE